MYLKKELRLNAGVLIDTWWNVNENTIVQEIDLSIVLIDTWWNVNVYRTKRSSSNFRFNRYMVECEFGRRTLEVNGRYSFNRYMVECELTFNPINNYDSHSFNRYMVECEFFYTSIG